MATVGLIAFVVGQALMLPSPTLAPVAAIVTQSPIRPTASPSPAPTATPAPTAPPTAPPTPKPTAPIDFLRSQVPPDLLPSCHVSSTSERAHNAIASLTCPLNNGYIQAIAFHLYATPEQMDAQYNGRLADYGVQPASGDCSLGTPGDGPWFSMSAAMPEGRLGCFTNENRDPNIRWTDDRTLVYGALVGVRLPMDQSTSLYFEDWQKNIDFQLTLAEIYTPGETPGERYSYLINAQAVHDQAQAELDAAKGSYLVGLDSEGLSNLVAWWSVQTGERKRAQ